MKKLVFFLAVATIISFVACQPKSEKEKIPSMVTPPSRSKVPIMKPGVRKIQGNHMVTTNKFEAYLDSFEEARIQWISESSTSIIVCNAEGTVVYMNSKAVETFTSEIIGQIRIFCHPGMTDAQFTSLLTNHKTYTYTKVIDATTKRLYCISGWFENELFKGIIEQSYKTPYVLPVCP